MQERGAAVDHATINCWVLKYSLQLEEAFHRHLEGTMTEDVGIFWGDHGQLIMGAVPLAEGVDDGSFVNGPYDHDQGNCIS